MVQLQAIVDVGTSVVLSLDVSHSKRVNYYDI